jgi:uncharacterized protein VirK/YbjX
MLATTQNLPGISGPLAWPDAGTMFANAFELGLERRAKYAWRLLLTWQVRAGLLRELSGSGPAEALFRARPRAFYPLMNHLIDRRLGARARLQATLASLHAVAGTMGDEAGVSQLLADGLTLLKLDDGTRIVLSLNEVSFHEGLWQVALVGEDGVRLYSIGFGFADAGTLLVGNVQGPSLKDEGLDRIRDATHAAHGMRPPHLLVHALRLLAARWDATSLRGVDPENHVKGRWNLRGSRLRFDYRAFWAEHDGLRDAEGNWNLPLATAQRPIEDVPTKRRAMYRRRYAMLEALQEAVRHLGRPQSADPVTTSLVDAGTGHAELAANASTLDPAQVA